MQGEAIARTGCRRNAAERQTRDHGAARLRQLLRLAGTAAAALLVAAIAPHAEARTDKRYGIEGLLVDYDSQRQIFRVKITNNQAEGRFGGSVAGVKAPSDVKMGAEMEFHVSPTGSVLSRTVIKSTQGTGLDNSGTQEGFEKAVLATPRDRRLIFSIEKTSGNPPYKIKTVIIPLTEEEIQRRLDEILQDDE